MRVPSQVGIGKAQLAISFDQWKEGKVAPSRFDVEVAAAKTLVKLEAVSSRLKKELIHPNRGSTLHGVSFSPDGKRLIAGDLPGGVLQLWDAKTGKQLTKIETGDGSKPPSNYFFVTPDWKTVFVGRDKRKAGRVEQDGKKLTFWEYDGDVRTWDLATGQLKESYRHTPARGMGSILLSPGGGHFVSFENLSGEVNAELNRAVSLWDVKTNEFRPLPDDLRYFSVYFPDGETLAAPTERGKDGQIAIKLIDLTSGKEKASFPVAVKSGSFGYIALSPDGKVLVGEVRAPKQHSLKFWDVESGKEVASFENDKNEVFVFLTFSPDGRTLAVTNAQGEIGKLFLFDVPGRKLAKTISLGEDAIVRRPVFSPDGKWIAVAAAQVIPGERRRSGESPEDVPQPRLYLVNVAAGEVRETLVMPQCFPTSACFSPDGKTLATAGYGKVLLWDLGKPPGDDGPPTRK